MSYLKINPDLFLGETEIERLIQFLDQDGFRKNIRENSSLFGLIKNHQDLSYNNGKIERDLDLGDGSKTIKHKDLFAIDKNGLFIYKKASGSIVVPNTGSWYWVKISHQYTTQELGTFSISETGNLVGNLELDLTKAFRGQPFYPTRIKFLNSTLNTAEYDVLSVSSSNTAIIQHPGLNGSGEAQFVPETGLKIAIVGTFTPGVGVTLSDGAKYPFQFDSCNLTLVLETVSNTRPTFSQDYEFFLARVRVSGGNVIVQDKRVDNWETKGSYQNIDLTRSDNPLVGIEAVKFTHPLTTKDTNIVEVAWGVRSSNWSVDSTNNLVALSAPVLGGKYKSIDDFVDGALDGWRVYTKNGKYSRVITSVKAGSAINLTLDVLDVDNYFTGGGVTPIAQELLVVPNTEEIQFKFTANAADNTPLPNETFTFPINTAVGRCELLVFKTPTCLYNVKYRYKNFKEYTEFEVLPSDTVNGYYNEASFDTNGNIIVTPTRVTYNPATADTAFLLLTMNPNSYSSFVSKVDRGDLPGVLTSVLNNATPVKTLTVGSSKQYQYYYGTISLSTNHIITLSTAGAVEGNEFFIHIRANISPGVNTFQIRQDYVSPSDTGVLIKQLTPLDYSMINANTGLYVRCIFDIGSSSWIVTGFLEKLAGYAGKPLDFIYGPEVLTGSGLVDTNNTYQLTNQDANVPTFDPTGLEEEEEEES